MKRRFNIRIHTEQSDYTEAAVSKLIPTAEPPTEVSAESEKIDFYTEGELVLGADGKYCLSYDESELTGMEGSVTSVNFDMSERGLVTLMRTGNYRMVMVFERGVRHICTYQTPYMPIELCVATRKLENSLGADGGELYVEYSIETNSMRCELTKLRLVAMPIK